MGSLCAEVEGGADREVGEGAADDLRVHERLHATGQREGPLLATGGEGVVLPGKAEVRLVLVVDDGDLAVGVDVDAVDRSREQDARVLHLRRSPTTEPPLEEPRLEALEHAGLEVEQRAQVPTEAEELPVLAREVRHQRLRQGPASADELVLMAQVRVELLVERRARLLESRGVPHKRTRARKPYARVRLGAPQQPLHLLAIVLPLHRALVRGAQVGEDMAALEALLRAGDELAAAHLEDAVREGAHLRAREACVRVAQA